MGINQIQKVRDRRWWRLWRKIVWERCIAPFHNTTRFFQLLVVIISFYLFFLNYGLAAVTDKIANSVLVALAFICAIPVFILLNCIIAWYQVDGREKQLGEWLNNRFVYHQSQHLDTTVVNADKTEQFFDIEASDAEPNTLVQFHVSLDGRHARLKTQIGFTSLASPHLPWNGIGTTTQMTHRIGEDRKVRVFVHILPGTDPTVVKISMVSWEI